MLKFVVWVKSANSAFCTNFQDFSRLIWHLIDYFIAQEQISLLFYFLIDWKCTNQQLLHSNSPVSLIQLKGVLCFRKSFKQSIHPLPLSIEITISKLTQLCLLRSITNFSMVKPCVTSNLAPPTYTRSQFPLFSTSLSSLFFGLGIIVP